MAAGNLPSTPSVPFWRDIRFWQVFLQIVFLILLIAAIVNLSTNIASSLASNNQTVNFDFLDNRAGFEIGGAADYSPDDSFFEAFLVGVRNTLSVVTVGLVAATVIGVLFGIFLLSNNWLIRTISRSYVEVLRNTPLLVQLVLWYFVVFTALPRPDNAVNIPASGAVNITWRWVIYFVLGIFIAFYFRKSQSSTRNGVIIGALSAASIIEIGFWRIIQLQLLGTETAIANAELLRSGSLNAPFLIYAIVSALLILAAYFAIKAPAQRGVLVGIFAGQLLGGILFYFGIIPAGTAYQLEGVLISMSVRGIHVAEWVTTPRYPIWLAFITLGIILAAGQWFFLGEITDRTGKPFPRVLYAVLAIVILTVLGWWFSQIGSPPVTQAYLSQDAVVTIDENNAVTVTIDEEVSIIDDRDGLRITVPTDDVPDENQPLTVFEAIRGGYVTPRQIAALDTSPVSFFPVILDERGRRYESGTRLSLEYMAVLTGLVIYTSAFIAEIVRAGIQAVPRGQREAAGAVGLNSSDTLTQIILPQALRVIIPPMGNQYLNLAKNSSLAIAVSYFDVYNVMNTIINQSGQSVSGIVIIMVSYLIISLTISFVMNLVNQRFQLVTR